MIHIVTRGLAYASHCQALCSGTSSASCSSLPWPTKVEANARNLCVTLLLQLPQILIDPPRDLRKVHSIDVLPGTENIPPHRRSHDRIALDKSLIIRRQHASPLHEQILEVLIPHTPSLDTVENRHAVLSGIEEMIQQILMPVARVVGGEHPQAHSEQVHVQERDLRPGVERRQDVVILVPRTWFRHA